MDFFGNLDAKKKDAEKYDLTNDSDKVDFFHLFLGGTATQFWTDPRSGRVACSQRADAWDWADWA